VEVSVADRGSGIAEDAIGKLFQPFFTTKAGGIGLGLQICLSAIQRLGGDLTARNRDGGGAVFSFNLPEATSGDAANAEMIEAIPLEHVGGLREIANG
jgi:C4-dicarboxylate-specific signal transduction histidine kinase